ncbi:hypothetical protein IGI42_004145 [Enterococcus sp. AZ109]
MTANHVHQFSLHMLIILGLVLFISLVLRYNHGLFLARTTYKLKKYRYDSAHRSERELGNKVSSIGIKIGLPLFLIFLILTLLTL